MRNASVDLDALMPLILERLSEGGTVRFTPHGNSMRPMLDGVQDQVVLAPMPERLHKYDLPLYRRDDGHYVLHRIIRVDGTYTCIGDHQFKPEPGLRHDQMLALVVAFVRKGHTYSVTAPHYRFYCRIWHITRPPRYLLARVIGLLRRRSAKDMPD